MVITLTYDEFLKQHNLDEFEHSLLWSLVAHSMRAVNPLRDLVEQYERIPLRDLFAPFSHFLTETGIPASRLDLLIDTFKNDGTYTFPFGSFDVEDGHVISVTTTPLRVDRLSDEEFFP
jgi:hypothetical protein